MFSSTFLGMVSAASSPRWRTRARPTRTPNVTFIQRNTKSMDAKKFILEVFRETDFIKESLTAGASETDSQVKESIAAINKACSAFLNGQDVEPHVDRFMRRQMEVDVYEEFEIWGKFSPPPQIIKHDNDSDESGTA